MMCKNLSDLFVYDFQDLGKYINFQGATLPMAHDENQYA